MAETLIVQTNSGPVRGALRHGVDKQTEFYAFKGIPYGKAPVGELRFKVSKKLFLCAVLSHETHRLLCVISQCRVMHHLKVLVTDLEQYVLGQNFVLITQHALSQ